MMSTLYVSVSTSIPAEPLVTGGSNPRKSGGKHPSKHSSIVTHKKGPF